ncbi:MAG: hypothetical protein EOP47_07525 [Sphingobacteriaceae bacterium]|nr:MAG: hypothetical protein EOP47_07525 [Sphingobacteriaceae bacterium]
MLKKSGAILLVLLYTLTVSGFAINLHYCGKLLASVKISAPVESCTKGMKKMKCCNDKQIHVKVKDAHQNASFNFIAKTFALIIPKAFLADHSPVAHTPLKTLLVAASPHAPPDGIAVFVKNCTFRI